jgi:hypothetical protein
MSPQKPPSLTCTGYRSSFLEVMNIRMKMRLRMSGVIPQILVHDFVGRTEKLHLYLTSHYFFQNISFFDDGIAIRI